MKIILLTLFLVPSLVFAVKENSIQVRDNKASSAKAKGNNSRIQALQAEVIILHQCIDNIQLTPGPKENVAQKVIRAIRVPKETKAVLAPQARKVLLGHLVHRDKLVQLVQRAHKE